MTGFWKTDQNVTLGLFHFIGPANSHTHTLHLYLRTVALPGLADWSAFADHVKSQLRQRGPWRTLDGRYGSDIHPCVSETSLRPSRLVWAYD